MANPPAPDVTFWVIERVKYLSGLGWEPRPVYIAAITDNRVHDYTQDIAAAKQFPTKEAAATFLKDALANNEAFAVVEHAWIKRDPPTPDVEAIASDIVGRSGVLVGRHWLHKAIASALTAHTASLQARVEELERALILAEDILSRNGLFSRAPSWSTEAGEVHPMTAITTIRAALRPAGDTLSGGGEDARQQALEEAARVADAEEISCRETLANRRTEMEHVSWAAAANTARLLAKAIRSLKATAPTIPLSTGGWNSDMEKAPEGVVLLVVVRSPTGKPWRTLGCKYGRFSLDASDDIDSADEGPDGQSYAPAGWYETTLSDETVVYPLRPIAWAFLPEPPPGE